MIRWKFPSNGHGQINGIHDSGMHYFTGNKLKSLAREICQNSLDAGVNKPVRVEFEDFEIPRDKLPGAEYLKYSFEQSLLYWKEQKDKGTKKFFEKAIEVLERDSIRALRISDYNTCGLTGSEVKKNSNWSNLVKASGASDKNSTAGGSFGIGKYATFACSDLRTVYYSTLDHEGINAYQGVARLVTFENEDNEETQGVGYFGNCEKNTPVFEPFSLQENYARQTAGSDIFIAGFSFGDNWADEMICAIIEDFMVAIWDSKLDVIVEGVSINRDTLDEVIEKYRSKISKFALDSYTVLTSEKTVWIEDDFMNMGGVKLGLIIDSSFNKKIAMIRQNGMRIFDQSNINPNIQFAGVLRIEGQKINQFLRKLENPKHDKWETGNASNKGYAQKVLRNLRSFLKEKLDDLIEAQPDEVLDAEGVGEFLPDDIDDDAKNENEADTVTDEIKNVEVVVREKKPRAASARTETDDSEDDVKETGEKDDTEGDESYTHKGGKGGGHRKPDSTTKEGEGNEPVSKKRKIQPQNVRVISLSRTNNEYSILLTADQSYEDCTLKVMISGEVGTYPLELKSARSIDGEQVTSSSNEIQAFSVSKDVPKRFIVTVDYDDYCGMEVELYGNKI